VVYSAELQRLLTNGEGSYAVIELLVDALLFLDRPEWYTPPRHVAKKNHEAWKAHRWDAVARYAAHGSCDKGIIGYIWDIHVQYFYSTKKELPSLEYDYDGAAED
jgi:hypothetical protein